MAYSPIGGAFNILLTMLLLPLYFVHCTPDKVESETHFLKDSNLKTMQTFCPPSLCGDLEAVFEGFTKSPIQPLDTEDQYRFFTYTLSSMWN
jgi:hypothetical protein